ncbi:carboxypeptidase regulatory-like domain-containing protein [Lysobacter tyrosinilyticus]
MDSQRLAITLLVFALIVASARMLWFASRRMPRPRAGRVVVLLLLQTTSALLLYRTLVPPTTEMATETLVVATGNAPANQVRARSANERVVALPEVGTIADVESVPDLATALRWHPATARLRIVGRGLTARDRDSAQGLPIEFVPMPLPRGLVELPTSVRAQSGADFEVRGAVNDVRRGSIELLDPSGERIDRQSLDASGRFLLRGAARAPGLVEFRVRVVDAGGATLEESPLPVEIFAAVPLRVLVIAGTPDAELKYLRRWALDSGVRLTTQVQLGGGMQLGDAPVALNAATLKEFDAMIIDERAWDGLGEARRHVVSSAVRNGLGLLVRVTGPISATTRSSLAALGLRLADASIAPTFALPLHEDDPDFTAARLGPGSVDAPTTTTATPTGLPELNRQTLRIDTAGAHPWLRDAAGQALAAWRPLDRGRVAAWLPMDTFQLVLVGRADAHAALWSQAIATVARPVATATLAVPANARQGTRMAVCGLAEDATIATLGTQPRRLLIDPATGPDRCAGFWPQTAGWHILRSGKAQASFHVRAPQDTPGAIAMQDRDATQQLTLAPQRTAHVATAPTTRWPWFLAWLIASAALWWLERKRTGRFALG